METVTQQTVEDKHALQLKDYIEHLNQLPAEHSEGTGSAVWAELTESLRTTNELSQLARALV